MSRSADPALDDAAREQVLEAGLIQKVPLAGVGGHEVLAGDLAVAEVGELVLGERESAQLDRSLLFHGS